MPKIDLERLRRATLDNALQLVQRLLPNGVLKGDEFCVGSIDGSKGQSLKINLKTGVWADFNVQEHKGADLISLQAAVDRVSYIDAARRVAAKIGGEDDLQPPSTPAARKVAIDAIVPVSADAPDAHLPIGLRLPWPRMRGFTLTAKWAYRDGAGKLINYVVRFENRAELNAKGKPTKQVLPYSYFGEGGWRWRGLGKCKGPLYGLDKLTLQPDYPVLLVEGEKAADAAAELFPGIVAATWPGGLGQLTKADLSPLRGRKVTYWPDADEAGTKSVEVVARLLTEAGVGELRVVELPTDLPRGWDLADDPPAGLDLRVLLRSAAPPTAMQEALLRDLDFEVLLKRLVFNSQTEQFVDVVTGYRAKCVQLTALFRHKEKSIAIRMLEDERLPKVQRYAYLPGIVDRIVVESGGLQALNLWRPSEVVPEEGDPTPFIEHLRYLCTSEEEFDHLVRMLAFMAQKLGRKLKSAIVLVGPPGTGKSYIGHVMREILGAHNTAEVTSTEIKSDYNPYVEAKSLVIVEEVLALGKIEIMNKLKPLITQPKVRINEKYVASYEIENRANFLFLSNHEDALFMDREDRRYFIVISDRAPKKTEYYKRLWSWTRQNVGVILNWLLSCDLSTFNPDAAPPETAGKRRMIEAGRSDVEVLVADAIAGNEHPFDHDLVELRAVWRAINDAYGSGRGTLTTRPALTRAMKAAGAIDLGQKNGKIDGKTVRRSLWAVRDVNRYRNMSSQALIEKFTNCNPEETGGGKSRDTEILF